MPNRQSIEVRFIEPGAPLPGLPQDGLAVGVQVQ
jgi:hypothetical protein